MRPEDPPRPTGNSGFRHRRLPRVRHPDRCPAYPPLATGRVSAPYVDISEPQTGKASLFDVKSRARDLSDEVAALRARRITLGVVDLDAPNAIRMDIKAQRDQLARDR